MLVNMTNMECVGLVVSLETVSSVSLPVVFAQTSLSRRSSGSLLQCSSSSQVESFRSLRGASQDAFSCLSASGSLPVVCGWSSCNLPVPTAPPNSEAKCKSKMLRG